MEISHYYAFCVSPKVALTGGLTVQLRLTLEYTTKKRMITRGYSCDYVLKYEIGHGIISFKQIYVAENDANLSSYLKSIKPCYFLT